MSAFGDATKIGVGTSPGRGTGIIPVLEVELTGLMGLDFLVPQKKVEEPIL
jgi:hypothetical protein